MRFNAQPWRLLVLSSLLVLFGCTTPKPVPTPKIEPPATTTPTPKPVPPPPVVQPAPPAPTPPTTPLILSDGPWNEGPAVEATLAIVVTVRTNGLFRDRVGVHYLHPAHKTTYRLVQLRNDTPVTLAQKDVPEACSSTFRLTNENADPADIPYTVHSTLKQIPVDPTHAVTLNLRVNCRRNDNSAHIDESLNLNGLSRAECGQGAIIATIEVLSPAAAFQRLATTTESAPTAATTNPAAATPTTALTDWDLLYKKFQLTGQEARVAGWFQLTRDASIQFPDIRFSSEQIEISEDHSLIKLRNPVRIDWEGRNLTSGDAVIHITADTIQFEANNIQTN